MRLPSVNWLPPLLLVSISVASAKPQNQVGGGGYEYAPQGNGVGGGGYDYTPAQNGGGGGGYDYTPQNNNQFVEGNGNVGGGGGGYQYTPAVPNQNQNGDGGDGSPGGYDYSPPAQPRSNSLEGEADANGTSSTAETPMDSTTPASESETTSPTEESMPESSSTTSAAPDIGSMNGTSEASTTAEAPGETAAASSLDNTVAVSQDEPSVSLVPPRPVPFLPAAEASRPSSTPLLNVAALNDVPITLLSIAGNSGGTSGNTKNANDLHVDFTRYRYHVESGKLHRIGNTTGVCPENMRYFAVPGKGKSGSCDCDYYQCSRPLIYSADGNQCFWAWSQGPCGDGEWFVFDKDLKKGGKCVKRPCPQSRSSGVSGSLQYLFQSPHDGVCYEAGTQGYCKDKDERLLIYPGEPIPTCRKFTSCFPLTVPQELQCVYGNKYFHDGNC